MRCFGLALPTLLGLALAVSGCSYFRNTLFPPDFVRDQFFKGSRCIGSSPDDEMVKVGGICVDVYEASVWNAPAEGLVLGSAGSAYPCKKSGIDCAAKLFARSQKGIEPAANITWFQAQMACASVGKRLLTSAEWQVAALGSPDELKACNVSSASVRHTGDGNCRSPTGIVDGIGNLSEWVADWSQTNTKNDGGEVSTEELGNDKIAGIDEAAPESFRMPAALLRGGSFRDGDGAGTFALDALNSPMRARIWIGFRCAR